MSKYPEIFAGLFAEFDRSDVKTRPQGGKQLSYITARTAMNRLDDVLGPENWWDEYFPMENSVLCKLSIRLPDGSVLTKCDAGGYAGMSDQGDDDKSGFSDAFKRAAVKFGVGRYLYRDGVPRFEQKPAVGFQDWLKATVAEINGKWVDDVTRRYGARLSSAPGEVVNKFQLSNHLLKWAKARAIVSETSTTCEGSWSRHGLEFANEALDYCRKKWSEARAKIKPPREPGDDDDPGIDDVLDVLAEQGAMK